MPLSSNGRTLIKGYPVKDTVSNIKFHSKEVIVVRIHAAAPNNSDDYFSGRILR